jgi:23S rRNA (adenine2503-C2)-methyltransferase
VAWVEALREVGPAAEVRRAIRAVYRGEVAAPSDAPGLSRALARALAEVAPGTLAPRTIDAAPDGTEKLLLGLDDGKAVEAVLIPGVRTDASREHMRAATAPHAAARARPRAARPPRASGCVSSQVGCGVRCAFCASGLEGLARNLAPGEVTAQVLALRARARARGLHLATVVVMGTGEPLHNTDALLVALGNLTSPWGGELSPAAITVSTVGVVEGLERLAREGPAPNVALSLHAPDDATRAAIVPLAPRLPPVRDLVRVAGEYARTTRRFVTVSYVLLDEVNDAPAQADALAALVRGSGVSHVNLIPWNAVEGLPFRASPPARAQAFFERLRAAGLPCHLRRARGTAATAACGQLRRLRSAP